jgi:hypothetical protein
MSDERRMREIRDWLDAEARVDAPTRMFEHVFEATREMRQVRTWPRWLPSRPASPAQRALALGVVLLLAAVLGFGALAGVGQKLRDVERSRPTPEPAVTGIFASTCPHPQGVIVVASAVWVSCTDQVRRFDSTGAVTGATPAGAIAIDGGGAWVSLSGGLRTLDPATLATGPIFAATHVTELALDASSVWAIEPAEQRLLRIDRTTRQQVAVIQLPSAPGQLVAAAGRIWVTLPDEDRIAVVDPAANVVSDLVPAAHPSNIAGALGSIWVVSGTSPAAVIRIDPTTLGTETVALPATPASPSPGLATNPAAPGLATLDGAIWVVDGSRLDEIDPSTLGLMRLFDVRAPDSLPLEGVAPLGQDLLVVDTAGNRVLQVTP